MSAELDESTTQCRNNFPQVKKYFCIFDIGMASKPALRMIRPNVCVVGKAIPPVHISQKSNGHLCAETNFGKWNDKTCIEHHTVCVASSKSIT